MGETDEDAIAAAWERADAAQIKLLRIPTPFMVGRVNCYLIEDDPLTLIDTGPNSGKALDELETQLAALGHAIEDLERIIITHQHIDHMGLAAILARRSGAEVAALDLLAPVLEQYRENAEADDTFAGTLMRRHGIPDEVRIALRTVSQSFRSWGGAVGVDLRLHPGDLLKMGNRTLEVHHRPGHSPSDTIFWDPQRAILLGADHLIARISSNPLISRPLDGSSERPKALITYLQSLRLTREMAIEVVYPGHGEPVSDHVELIDQRFLMHERRAAKIARLLDDGPLSAFEIARALWGNVAVTQSFLTLSEVIGHADLLIERGEIVEQHDPDSGLSLFCVS